MFLGPIVARMLSLAFTKALINSSYSILPFLFTSKAIITILKSAGVIASPGKRNWITFFNSLTKITPLPSTSAFLNATSGLNPYFSIALSNLRTSIFASSPLIGRTALAVAGLFFPCKFFELGTEEFSVLSRISSKVFTNVAFYTIAPSKPKEVHAASIKTGSIVLKSFLKLSFNLTFRAV